MTVAQRFTDFLANIALTPDQRSDGATKHAGVRAALNWHYFDSSSASANSILVGSWGKATQIRPPRDVDAMFFLPSDVHARFEQRYGNRQSQLLQEVKGVLQREYPSTEMSADGQVVSVPFGTYAVEVVPAFKLQGGKYLICDTNNGGRYKVVDADAEIEHVRSWDESTKGNARHLIRMMKCWQDCCSVPMKSFWIELLSIEFLSRWRHAGETALYYDFMVRDFFEFVLGRRNGRVSVPGTNEQLSLGDGWGTRAESALLRARKACEFEAKPDAYGAGVEWQKIFSTYIPLY